MIVIATFILILFAGMVVCQDDKCSFYFQSSCYDVNDTLKTRAEAAASCEADGGHLVDITSLEEQQFVVGLLSVKYINDAWFGLLKTESSTNPVGYTWSDGSHLQDEAWHPFDNNENSPCMRIHEYEGLYYWSDRYCSARFIFVCEFEVKESVNVRLTNDGGSLSEGRVEVEKQGDWHAVCYHTGSGLDFIWNARAASVVCRQLGFLNGASFAVEGVSTSGYHVNDVRCPYGLFDHLQNCSFEFQYQACNDFGQAAVKCFSSTNIRLSGQSEGNVEIQLDGDWHAVCYHAGSDNDLVWNTRAALVVCRQLGFVTGTPFAAQGVTTSGYHVNEVNCPYAGDQCSDGHLPFQSSCYQVNDTLLPRADAAASCEADGGHLVDITSLEEQQFVASILTASGGGDAWFGLLKKQKVSYPNYPHGYIWSDGSPLLEQPWHNILADDYTVCMRLIDFGAGYGWYDWSCDEEFKFVCEIKEEITDIRLANNTSLAGSVEVYLQEHWWPVCYDVAENNTNQWNHQAAWVACKLLGYQGGRATYYQGSSTETPFKVYDVECGDGSYHAYDNINCSYKAMKVDCKESKLAGVVCFDSGECSNGYFPFQHSCYKVNNTKLPRHDAAAACGHDGGHLVDITSLEEQEFIANIFTNSGSGDTWFGLRKTDEGEYPDYDPDGYTWSDGSPLQNQSWHTIKTYFGATCMRLREEHGYKWYDWPCDVQLKFVCEIEVPQATTILPQKQTVVTETSMEVSQHSTDNEEKPEGQARGFATAVIGGVIGVLFFVIFAFIIVFFVYKRKKTQDTNKPAPRPTALSSGTNPTYETDAQIGRGEHEEGVDFEPEDNYDDANRVRYTPGPGSITHNDPDSEYTYVDANHQDAARNDPDNEYNYVDTNITHPGPARNDPEDEYSYIDTSRQGGAQNNPDSEYNYVDANKTHPNPTRNDPEAEYSYVDTSRRDDVQNNHESDYNYVDANYLRPAPDGNGDGREIQAAMQDSRPVEQSKTEGWKKNSIYSTSDGVDDPSVQDEGWADNIIYGD